MNRGAFKELQRRALRQEERRAGRAGSGVVVIIVPVGLSPAEQDAYVAERGGDRPGRSVIVVRFIGVDRTLEEGVGPDGKPWDS